MRKLVLYHLIAGQTDTLLRALWHAHNLASTYATTTSLPEAGQYLLEYQSMIKDAIVAINELIQEKESSSEKYDIASMVDLFEIGFEAEAIVRGFILFSGRPGYSLRSMKKSGEMETRLRVRNQVEVSLQKTLPWWAYSIGQPDGLHRIVSRMFQRPELTTAERRLLVYTFEQQGEEPPDWFFQRLGLSGALEERFLASYPRDVFGLPPASFQDARVAMDNFIKSLTTNGSENKTGAYKSADGVRTSIRGRPA
jgi:hypothetical protein